jgi:malonyl-CoA/methylmalonyl-CoA synthetase
MANPLFDTLFAAHAGQDTPFLHLPGGTALTHQAFLGMAARFAHVICDCGLAPGDRLALQVSKTPEALAVYAACAQAGVIFLPLNTAYTAAEVDYFVGNAGAKLVLCDPSAEAALAPIAQSHGAALMTLAAGSESFAAAAKGKPSRFATVARTEDDLAAFLYTSGTTGRSKGAMLTHRNLLSNAQVLAEAWAFTVDDVLLHALPIFHTHGLFVATNIALVSGASMIFLPKFDLDAVLAALPRATTMMGVPTFYTRLLGLAAHMRLFVSGSAPLLAETHRAFEARTGHRILERYGMTETNMNCSNPYLGERRAGTVGLPLPGVEVRVCDDAGAALAPGEIGTLEVRGPNVFQGYWQMPEKTAAELRADGFFITGDLAKMDTDGYVTIVGRGKDLIISGGYNIYPKEIELVLDALPGVLESAVVGAPHGDFGESVVAVLVADGPLQLEAVQAAIGSELARFKQPRHYAIVDALPRNTMGKVQKNLLRDQFADVFSAS